MALVWLLEPSYARCTPLRENATVQQNFESICGYLGQLMIRSLIGTLSFIGRF
jgi:hypothetical protein